MARTPRGKASEIWQQRLARFQISKKTIADFCAEEGVSTASFYAWRRKLTKQPDPPAFQALHISTTQAALTVELPGGIRIQVPADQIDLARALTRELVEMSRDPQQGGA